MRIKVRVTAGDELDFMNICDKHGIKYEIGGDPKHDFEILGLERPVDDDSNPYKNQVVRTDWGTLYIFCDKLSEAHGIRSDFRHFLCNNYGIEW